MEIVLETPAKRHELRVQMNGAGATVGDLIDSLPGVEGAEGVTIDARFLDRELALEEIGLYEGATVAPAQRDGAARPVARPARFRVLTIGGLDSGEAHEVDGDDVLVGRDPSCDVVLDDASVSRRHCRISLATRPFTVTDLGSANGTWVEGRRIAASTPLGADDVLEVGDVALAVAAASPAGDRLAHDPLREVDGSGTMPFNRPPRTVPSIDREPLQVPDRPTEQSRPPFSVAAVVAPIFMGLVMVVVLGNPLYAIFTLLSPIMAVGNWYESRHRAGSASRGARGKYLEEVAELTTQLERRMRSEQLWRRDALPHPAEVVRRATDPSVRLWERRADDADFLQLSTGLADVSWTPALERSHATPPEEVAQLLERNSSLRLVPAEVDLARGGVVGLSGPREAALAVARGLICQAAVLHGPADLGVTVLSDGDAAAWDWAKWLPHTRNANGLRHERMLGAGAEERAEVIARLKRAEDDGVRPAVTLLVVDGEGLVRGRNSEVRALLRGAAGDAAGIVIAESTSDLPAVCSTVVELAPAAGDATLHRPQSGETVERFLVAGMRDETARRCARSMARFEDAELRSSAAGLPDAVSLLPLLGLGSLDPIDVRGRWRATAADGTLEARVGYSEAGPFVIDLVRDGPHGLVGGTTGSGKSELLRTMVASLAVTVDPDHLNFVLVDYKGGSAFMEASTLPHAVGLVTDLDEQLGERALRSLEAELRYRERFLREHGASDLPSYLEGEGSREGAAPLPRLLVIIDEFATLAAELPDFVASLVGIAQRGRSLGVHMILATQRPSGAVNENIKANTNLRICLRVQTPQDSQDVIGTAGAASIGREQVGRAFVRLGPSEIVPIQTALVTGESPRGPTTSIELLPFEFGPGAARESRNGDRPGGTSDLSRLTECVRTAADASGVRPPRRPWLEPLPDSIPLEALAERHVRRSLLGDAVDVPPFALADDPDAQAQYAVGWDPKAGNLLIYGVPGSGTTSCLRALGIALATAYGPDELHIYGLDFGAGELGDLAYLPHVGAIVSGGDRERQTRLIDFLGREVERRRGLSAEARSREPRIVTMLDGFSAFASELEDMQGTELRSQLARVFGEGQEVGVNCVFTSDRPSAVPPSLASLARQRLVFRLADPNDFAQFGLRRSQVPTFTEGRAIVAGSGQVLQVGWPTSMKDALDRAAAAHPGEVRRPPRQMGVLPSDVRVAAIAGQARVSAQPWFVPVGIAESTLEPAGLPVYEGEHVLVAGPARSGKTTLLCALGELLAGAGVRVEAVAGARSGLSRCAAVSRVAQSAEEVRALVDELKALDAGTDGAVLLVDDAEALDDVAAPLAELVSAAASPVHVIASGRPDALRSLFNHWTQSLRRAKLGVLLSPDVQRDGDLLGVMLPRRQSRPWRPGLGYMVAGSDVQLVQAAAPEADPLR